LEKKLADETLAGATLYTTREPCTGRNEPKLPCADRIIERRIGRVVIGVLDPNDDIRGRGELRLRGAGIEVARFDSDLWGQIEELNRDFARLHAGGGLRRTKAQTSDPADSEQVGPNGHRVGAVERVDAEPHAVGEISGVLSSRLLSSCTVGVLLRTGRLRATRRAPR
jgi:Invertebrate-AID/APOBEC-deaminase